MAGAANTLIEWFFDVSEPSKNLHRLAVFLHHPHQVKDDKQFQKLVLAEMYHLSNDSRSQEDVIQFDWLNWNEQEYICGGPVSVCKENVLSSMKGDLELSATRVHFAAAEFSCQFTGYVEGALRSGERAADRILGIETSNELKAKGTNWVMFVLVCMSWLFIRLIIALLRLVENVVQLSSAVYHKKMKQEKMW